ncbi:hypothetical protein AMECASPLE_037476 [Ameca splendens]|uniref:Uncharacterized protein n=1 Tax=Ameca splendens TaxID=208324 RepID=A0ABV0XWX5_9TELE
MQFACSPCLCGISPGSPASSHSPNTTARLTGYSKVPLRCSSGVSELSYDGQVTCLSLSPNYCWRTEQIESSSRLWLSGDTPEPTNHPSLYMLVLAELRWGVVR